MSETGGFTFKPGSGDMGLVSCSQSAHNHRPPGGQSPTPTPCQGTPSVSSPRPLVPAHEGGQGTHTPACPRGHGLALPGREGA